MERFRRQVARHFGGRPRKGVRYSAELRAEAVALAQAAVEQEQSLRSVAAGLGIGSVTLAGWLEAPPKTEWRAVEVVEEPDREIVTSPGLPGLVLITAGGHRLEGLCFDEAVLLLGALG